MHTSRIHVTSWELCYNGPKNLEKWFKKLLLSYTLNRESGSHQSSQSPRSCGSAQGGASMAFLLSCHKACLQPLGLRCCPKEWSDPFPLSSYWCRSSGHRVSCGMPGWDKQCSQGPFPVTRKTCFRVPSWTQSAPLATGRLKMYLLQLQRKQYFAFIYGHHSDITVNLQQFSVLLPFTVVASGTANKVTCFIWAFEKGHCEVT